MRMHLYFNSILTTSFSCTIECIVHLFDQCIHLRCTKHKLNINCKKLLYLGNASITPLVKLNFNHFVNLLFIYFFYQSYCHASLNSR